MVNQDPRRSTLLSLDDSKSKKKLPPVNEAGDEDHLKVPFEDRYKFSYSELDQKE